jgi:hypothetical protein
MKLTYRPSAGDHDHLIYDEEDQSGRTLALTYGPGPTLAALIVKAVNHHDELVAALREAIAAIAVVRFESCKDSYGPEINVFVVGATDDALYQAREVLNKLNNR